MGQDEDRGVVRRRVAPPAFPFLVAPFAANWPEHVAAHDRRAEVLPPGLGAIVVEPGLPLILLAEHRFERAGPREPVVQCFLGALAERSLAALIGPGRIAVE